MTTTSRHRQTDHSYTPLPEREVDPRSDGTAGPAAAGARAPAILRALWGDRRLGLATTIGAGSAWGLIAAWWMPRGPLTTSEALWSLAISLGIGIMAGFAMRSRWAMLLTPLTFAVVFELARLGTNGPTVDAPSFSPYGLIALVVGRGFHGLLSLLPLALGAFVGLTAARTVATTDTGPGRRPQVVARGAAVAAITLLFVSLFVLLAQPATTDPIVDADGEPVPGSIAELTSVEVNGHEQALMIRGHDRDNPVLLFLAGGPGGSEMGTMRNHLPELEQHFTVATWDQRGAGKSYAELDPTGTISLEGYVDDTIVVTDYLRERFGQDRIFLLGQSWGTTLGVLSVQQAPERYHAFIGTGQMVSQLATDRIFYEDTLAWARENGDEALAADLESIGPPPYERMLDYETALSHEQSVYAYDHSMNSEGQGQMSENILADEYTLVDEVHILGAFMDTFAALYPQLQDIDFRQTMTTFEVPMFFVQGAHEAAGRAELFEQWYPLVEAPDKGLAVLETSGHRPLWEQPDEFVDFMVDVVLARTMPQAAA